MKNRISSIFLFNLVFSIFLWLILLYFFPEIKKYKLELVEEYNAPKEEIHHYEDLYGDGVSEDVFFVRDFIGMSSVLIRDKGKIPFQWNLEEEFLKGQFFYINDINGDKIKEIFTFTHKNDSLFLNLYDIKSESEIFSKLFITKFKQSKGVPDIFIRNQSLIDLNNDGNKELFFTVDCAFTHVTRKLCLVDLSSLKITLSPVAGSTISDNLTFFDIDDDGEKEIMGKYFSYGNCKPDYPYSDRFSWLQIYNSNLKFKFSPKKIGNAPGRITILPLIKKDKNYFATYFNHSGTTDSSFIALYNNGGKLIRKRKPFEDNDYLSGIISTGKEYNRWLIYYSNGKVFEIDTLLNQKLINTISSFEHISLKDNLDLDRDGKLEIIYFNRKWNKLIVLKDDFSSSTEITHKDNLGPNYFSVQKEKASTPKLVISTKGKIYKYLYEKNKWFNWIWPVKILSLFIIFSIIWFFTLIQKRFIENKIKSEKRIAALQIKALSNNINPHFTLNILNSIGSLYASSDIDTAEMAMGKFAKMLRTALLSADKIAIPLTDEVNFAQNYLELEKIRMNGNLNYKIVVEQSVPQNISVPKMLIHTFVENAIKHGLKQLPQDKERNLFINISVVDNYLQIIVDDNGVGRNQPKQKGVFSTGQGLKILDEIIKLYTQLEGNKINYKISDSKLNKSGTSVLIKISSD